ncbi:Uncharacterised protein [Mycobacterium tuberculosis]|nr:Uncharacterised protein [Mycobacterium tuberculosis]
MPAPAKKAPAKKAVARKSAPRKAPAKRTAPKISVSVIPDIPALSDIEAPADGELQAFAELLKRVDNLEQAVVTLSQEIRAVNRRQQLSDPQVKQQLVQKIAEKLLSELQ